MKQLKTFEQLFNSINEYVQSKQNDALANFTTGLHETAYSCDIKQLDNFVDYMIKNKYDVDLSRYDVIKNLNHKKFYQYIIVFQTIHSNKNNQTLKRNNGKYKDDRFDVWHNTFPDWQSLYTNYNKLTSIADNCIQDD